MADRKQPSGDLQEQLAQACAQLNRVQKQLVHTEKLSTLGALVAGIAHEITTPIGAICSAQVTLTTALDKLKKRLGEQYPDHVSDRKLQLALNALDEASIVIDTGGGRVSTLVRRLRSFARHDGVELQPADLHAGIEDTLLLIQHRIRGRIRIVRELGRLPQVNCFAGQINQVLLNILVNAVQAIESSTSRSGTITIRTRCQGNTVTIAITDSGAGIAAEHLDQVFAPTFTTKGAGAGTGLGLSICRQIVETHRGRLWVESPPGEGATFTIELPTDLTEPNPPC